MKAHPTPYGGIVFRSRLEATWAAFFDLLGWRWEYEPPSAAFHNWLPDFVIRGEKPIYVEVKPIWSLDEANIEIGWQEAWTESAFLLLGDGPNVLDENNECARLGWVCDDYEKERSDTFGLCEAVVGKWHDGDYMAFGFSDVIRSYWDRISGSYGCNASPYGDKAVRLKTVLDLWEEAKRATQFKPPEVACKYCGAESLVWKQKHGGGWGLARGDFWHRCAQAKRAHRRRAY